MRWTLAAIGFAVAAGALWLLVVGFGTSVTFPDGREVSILAVTYGTNHVYVEGPVYAKLARRFISRPRVHRLGLRIFEQHTPSPSLMIWTQWHLPSTNEAPRFASVLDGHEVESEPVHAAIDAPYRDEKRAVMAWRFDNYPRFERQITMRFHRREPSYQPRPVGEITVRLPGEAMAQQRSALAPFAPETVDRTGTTFALVNLRSGEPPPSALSNRYNFVAPPTTAWFEVRHGSEVDTNWIIRGVEAFGSTGNRFSLPQSQVLVTNGQIALAFFDVLWPDEPGWRLAVEFARVREFGTNGLVTLGPFPALRLAPPYTTNLLAEAHGISFGTLGIRATTWYLPFRRSPYRRTTDLSVAYASAERALRVDLAGVRDDLGRDLRFGDGIDQARGRYVAGLELLTNTTSVELTFAVHRSVVVEFNVRPEFAKGWKRAGPVPRSP